MGGWTVWEDIVKTCKNTKLRERNKCWTTGSRQWMHGGKLDVRIVIKAPLKMSSSISMSEREMRDEH